MHQRKVEITEAGISREKKYARVMRHEDDNQI